MVDRERRDTPTQIAKLEVRTDSTEQQLTELRADVRGLDAKIDNLTVEVVKLAARTGGSSFPPTLKSKAAVSTIVTAVVAAIYAIIEALSSQ